MKKSILAILIVVMIISLLACAKQETDQSPEATLSEEQILKKYNGLVEECQRYKDWSAVVSVKGMFDSGQISEEQLAELASIPGLRETRELSEEEWAQTIEQVSNISEIINGKRKDLDQAEMDQFYEDLCAASEQDRIYISALDSQEKKDRVSEGLIYIDHWIREPVDDNFDLVKQFIMSDELTPGEVILLSCHMYYAKGQDEERVDFLDNQGIQDYTDEALTKLYDENVSN